LIESPISITLYVLTVLFLGLSVWLALRDRKRVQSRVMEG
jgi:putative tricarboxylic transport membrane protein